MSKAESDRDSLPRRTRRLLVYYLCLLTWKFVQALPERPAYCLLDFLSVLGYLVISRQRKLVLSNLRIGFPGMSDAERCSIAKRMYRNLGMNVAEFARVGKLRDSGRLDSLFDASGWENLERAHSRGKGVLILTAHLGNWELFGAKFSNAGYKLTVLARRAYYERYENLLEMLRRSAGVEVVDRNNVRGILRRLRAGHLVAILSDQDIRRIEGVYVDFLGKLAYTPTGIVTLALRTGSPILPAFIVRQSDGRHRVYIEPEVELIRTGHKGWDTLINTMRYTDIIEKYVKTHPEQWMWFHRRWRQRPEFGFLKGLGGTW